MNNAAELRRQVETALAGRIPAALSFRPPAAPELLSCGVAEVDAALGGGLPLGGITELTSASRSAGSGRTTLALCAVAELTRRGESCAYVDATDTLDPLSAAAMGADLRRLLWVRAGAADMAARPPAIHGAAPARLESVPKYSSGRGGCHPRTQAANMHRAIGELFRPAEATPDLRLGLSYSVPQGGTDSSRYTLPAPRRTSSHADTEAVSEDSALIPLATPDLRPGLPYSVPQGGTDSSRLTPPAPRRTSSHADTEAVSEEVLLAARLCPNGEAVGDPVKSSPDTNRFFEQTPDKKPRKTWWTALDQALRATDLLLNTGGFRALVLDMGDVPPEQARRVPPATWYRFRLQVEKSRTLFLLITQVACAHSCAAVSLDCREATADWQRAAESSPLLLAGMHYRVSVARGRMVDRTQKKIAVSAQALWSRACL